MTEKEQYYEEQISIKTQFWVKTMLILGIVLFPFIGIADYFVTPENFHKFLQYRVIITAIFVAFLFLNELKRSKNYQYTIIYIIIVFSAITIELMILSYGGHASTYYAGMNLLIIAALGLIPFSLPIAISTGLSIYVIYLVPILLFDKISNPKAFIANNIFMISTCAIALTWRILSQKSMLNELSLQYDLAQEKDKLALYSAQLEELVAERTKELHKSEQWHRSLLENATDGIIVLDRDGLILNTNQRACEMHGFSREALVGAHIRLLETDGNREQMALRMRQILAGESLVFEATHNRKDGGKIDLEISSKAIKLGEEVFIQSFYRDVTEKKKIQEHLFQSQKLESIGTLASGVAHDFNNILTAIMGHTELIRNYGEENEKIIRSANVIDSAARRSGRMISQLLDFSSKKARETLPFNLNDVVSDTVRLLERVIDVKIKLVEELDDALPPILGDVNHMDQVIMNLIVNARDAMPQGGRITISTSVVEARKGAPEVPPYIPEGRYVLLKVADTGTGIPAEVQNKMFEPFFTTKERGKGTGLGLSMAYGVIRDHKGYISVQSAPDKGTTFSVYLPALDTVMTAPGRMAAPAAVEGNETVLVVDDDDAMLTFMKESLEIYGYHVLPADDPLRALDIFRSGYQKIDIVITDMAMPNMSGKELIREIRAINPGARVLEISAYGKLIYLSGEDAPNGFAQKPFEARSLASTVRKIIDREPGRALNN